MRVPRAQQCQRKNPFAKSDRYKTQELSNTECRPTTRPRRWNGTSRMGRSDSRICRVTPVGSKISKVRELTAKTLDCWSTSRSDWPCRARNSPTPGQSPIDFL